MKSDPMIRHHVKYLQTLNVCYTLRILNFMSNVTSPMGSILLPLADESCILVHGCKVLVPVHFSKQA